MKSPEPAHLPEDEEVVVNHRTIVGRNRRAKTVAKIIEAALQVFAEKGRDAPVIDDFIKAAGIARGTFYNYFKSTSELLQATSTWLTDDLVESIEREIQSIPDPVIRHGMGCRLWMRKAESDPPWCGFVASIWFRGGFALKAPLRDIRLGIKSGGFSCANANVGYDLAMGTMHQGMIRLIDYPNMPHRKSYGDKIVQIILQGLGASPAKIEEAMKYPLPDMRRPTRTVGLASAYPSPSRG
ncbi:MAG: TetR/AcrR family transcriptional regulator [Betaproteobacteria bacterium]|nr:TetR/AcrR family transcriptional regulator [Betaproteobacteria bacterium]